MLCLIVYIVINLLINIPFSLYIVFNVFAIMLSNVLLQVARGFGDNLSYSIGSTIAGVTTVLFNIFFIVILKWNIEGMLLSAFFANLMAAIFLFFKLKLYKYFSYSYINNKILKKIIKYSLPLVPNGLIWWVINVSDRTIITIFLGASANGIYAISNKFSSILIQIYNVFNYYTNRGYKIYSEIGSFLIDFLVSGTIDVLCLREDGFVIGDWKTNRGGLIFESGYYKKDKRTKPAQMTNEWVSTNKTLLAPVNNLPDCNGSIYNLQTSMYAFMVEHILGIPCRGIWLCHIDSDFVLNEYGMPKRFPDGLYHIKKNPKEKVSLFKMNYLRDEIVRILKDRRRVVDAERVRSRDLFD